MPPLAELHTHYAGTLRWDRILAVASARAVDWSRYEDAFDLAYGRMPPIRSIMRRHRAGDPSAVDDWRALFIYGDTDAGAFARFQAKYNLLVAASAWSHPDTHRRLTQALADEIDGDLAAIAADARGQGIGWIEIRLLLGGRDARVCEHIFQRVVERCAAHSDAGLQLNLVASLPRQRPLTVWPAVRAVALGHHGRHLVGIDFCHVEEGHPPLSLKPFADELHAFNRQHPERALALLIHVGESYTDKSLESAVRWCHQAALLGAHRLGHAIALGIDPDHHGTAERHEQVNERRAQIRYDLEHASGLRAAGCLIDDAALSDELARLQRADPHQRLTISYTDQRLHHLRCRQHYAMQAIRELGCVIECCPTSNRRIAGLTQPAHHPLKRFLDAGLKVVVGADDPGLFDVTLKDEIELAATWSGTDQKQLISAAWAARSPLLSGRHT